MEGNRHKRKSRRRWLDDVEERTGNKYIQLKEMSVDRTEWRKKIKEWSSAAVNPH